MLTGNIVDEFNVKNFGKVTIRYPKMTDAEDLLEYLNSVIREQVFTTNKEKDIDWEINKHSNSLKEIEKRKRVSLVVEISDKVLGLGEIVKKPGARAHTGELGFGLKKKIRGKRIGSKLMRALIQEAREKLGIEKIILKTYRSNKPAIKLYQKFNFQEIGEIKNGAKYGEDYKNIVIMLKNI